ncbi:hypothetical protein, partial [Novacetimonas hansenii]|uniref:hypothetical protein n=1 Tax=Novacetimonas hansenii TaxID=436 RepID=UPI001A7E9818
FGETADSLHFRGCKHLIVPIAPGRSGAKKYLRGAANHSLGLIIRMQCTSEVRERFEFLTAQTEYRSNEV